MNIQVTDPIGALIGIAVILLVVWLVAYSAARMATDDLRTVLLTVSLIADGKEVILGVANRGMKPAYSVTVGTASLTATPPLALVGDVLPGGLVTTRVDRAALAGEDDVPSSVRVEWRIDGPGGPHRWRNYPLVRGRDTDGA